MLDMFHKIYHVGVFRLKHLRKGGCVSSREFLKKKQGKKMRLLSRHRFRKTCDQLVWLGISQRFSVHKKKGSQKNGIESGTKQKGCFWWCVLVCLKGNSVCVCAKTILFNLFFGESHRLTPWPSWNIMRQFLLRQTFQEMTCNLQWNFRWELWAFRDHA